MKTIDSVTIEAPPASCWIVEFSKGVEEGRRRKIYIVDVNLETERLVQMINDEHPNTRFVVYPIDYGTLTLPENMPPGDIIYSSDQRRVNDDLEVLFVPKDDIPTITFKPPVFGHEEGTGHEDTSI